MIAFLWALVKPKLSMLLMWGGVAIGIGLVLLKVRQSGRDAERARQMEKANEAARTRTRIETRNRALGGDPADIRGRMREQRDRLR